MAKRQRTRPDSQRLARMLRDHVMFEIGRFRHGVLHWYQFKSHDSIIDAMVRESCLLHMRLLLDFFYPRTAAAGTKYEDIFAFDYLEKPELASEELKAMLRPPSWLERYRDQLDWRLAHLTMKRIQFDEDTLWDPTDQFLHLERLITLFLEELSPVMKALLNEAQA